MTTTNHKKAVSLTIDEENVDFLKKFANQRNQSNSAMANDIFATFRKQMILHYFSEDAKTDNQNDLDFVNLDWNAYLPLIEKDEKDLSV